MGMYFQDDFWEAANELSKKDRDALCAGIVEYYFTDSEPQLKGAAKAVFIAIRARVAAAKTNSENAKKSRPKQQAKQERNASEPPSETVSESASEPPSETLAKPLAKQERKPSDSIKEGEGDIKEMVAKATPKKDQAGSLDGIDDEQFASFAKSAIQSFEGITGRPYRIPQATVIVSLRRIHDAGYTLDDVEAVIRSRLADWDGDAKMAKFIRPSTLFGDKFEGYLAASKRGNGSGVIDDELASYAEIFEP